MDFNKYIGIEFKAHGRDMTGLDCFGLVRLVLKNEFNKELPEWIENEEADFSGFKKTDDPKPGSIALFSFIGVPAHVGVYIGEGRVLHVAPGESAVAEKIDSRRLKGHLQGYYE
jgi:cell wall-associated NlpC family hydrolase